MSTPWKCAAFYSDSYPWSFQETHKYYKDHCNIICISVICFFFLCLPLSRACVDLPRWVDLFRTIEGDFARGGILWLYFTMSIAFWPWLSSWTPRQNFSCHLRTSGMDACAATAEVLYETSLSSDERGETSAVRRLQVLFPWPEHQQVPVHAACTKTRSNVACVAGVRKRRERELGRETTREEGGRSAPRALARQNSPFPF